MGLIVWAHISHPSDTIGSFDVRWHDVLAQPWLAIERDFTLTNAKSGKTVMNKENGHKTTVRVAVSMTPFIPGPYLLKSQETTATDDAGVMLSSQSSGAGLWVTRTVLDHKQRERFIVRTREGTGEASSSKTGLKVEAIPDDARMIKVHEGGWVYQEGTERAVGAARGRVVASAAAVVTGDRQRIQKWALDGDRATLTIAYEGNDRAGFPILDLDLHEKSEVPVRLVNGRKLEYEVAGASPADEDGYFTLVRFSHEAPRGYATALFNYRTSIFEVSAEENVLLVLLLMSATARSVVAFAEPSPKKAAEAAKISWKAPDPTEADQWGACIVEGSSAPLPQTWWK